MGSFDTPETDDPSPAPPQGKPAGTFFQRFKTMFAGKPDPSLRETIEEYIEEYTEETPQPGEDSASSQERALLSNILKLRNIRVTDVMVPRTDIIAINEDITQDDLLDLLTETQVSRLPVYRETLDDVLGTVHIKDILGALARGESVNVPAMITEIPIVSPAMPVINLILEMRKSRRHMAMVVDEFGGIDGLVTIGDIIQFIIGEVEDEHHHNEPPQITRNPDGSAVMDARLPLEDIERHFDIKLNAEDHEESDTLGGLVCFIAGHVPTRGEIIKHPAGLTFEVQDADPRRVNRVRVGLNPV